MSFLTKSNIIRTTVLKSLSINARTFGLSSSRSVSFKVQDDKDFLEKVENSKSPVIVDFFATWCGPCRVLEPRLENVLAKRNGKVTLAKVDIDSLGELAARYEIATIPSLVIFRNGKVEARLVGLQDEDKLDIWLDKALEEK